MEHSSSRDGSTNWPTPDYISQTMHVIDFLASSSQCSRQTRHGMSQSQRIIGLNPETDFPW
ncbi:hypothetical protein G4B88_027566 [Cannabis sativa]|uniref:Uncharacterized protein n=1 Tax=Cannabis sativa TaxID=3483 RepID=A0A7J6G694_CANSA|nr:hypothetical protein G4B88_027566 [Cannabis sativa]